MLRYKTMIGRSLPSRNLLTQNVGAAIGGKVINVTKSLSMPVSRKLS